MKIGFIGVGNMGRPMAANLLKAGYEVYVYDKAEQAVTTIVGQGAKACGTNSELASLVDVLFTSLPNASVVESVMTGAEGVFPSCREGAVVIDMSSVAPSTSRKMAEKAEEYGVKYVDAPVSGGTAGAEAGTLTIMVGADDETFENIKPILEVIGKNIYHVGGTGLGDAIKLVNNLLLGCSMAALAEALILGVKCGLDPQTIYEVVSVSSGNSYVLGAKLRQFIMKGDFSGGFAVELQLKDLCLALDAGREARVPLPMASAASQIFEAAHAQGMSREDMSAVVKVWEKMTGVEIRG